MFPKYPKPPLNFLKLVQTSFRGGNFKNEACVPIFFLFFLVKEIEPHEPPPDTSWKEDRLHIQGSELARDRILSKVTAGYSTARISCFDICAIVQGMVQIMHLFLIFKIILRRALGCCISNILKRNAISWNYLNIFINYSQVCLWKIIVRSFLFPSCLVWETNT